MKKLMLRGGLWLALLGLVGGLTLVAGCSRRPDQDDSNEKVKPIEDPWPRLVNGLRKETDAQTCRRLLSQVSVDISASNKPEYQPESLAPTAEPAYRRLLSLTDDQLNELKLANFSTLDAQYLAECLYFRDVVRSLELEGLPPLQQAELAFAWVCRQVVLSPSKRINSTGGVTPLPPLPPSFTLRRGSGSGLERAYVFLALLQQLGLEGCLMGTSAAAERPWTYVPIGGRSDEPKGPFTAIGVLIGTELHLFEPWRGSAFPAPLKALLADAKRLQPWLDDKTNSWDGSAQLISELVPILAAPLNAHAPRMKRLELELRNAGGVRLFKDPQEMATRFTKDGGFFTVKFWNAPNDLFALPRVLVGFLPREEGGNAADANLYQGYLSGSLPSDLIMMYGTRRLPDQYAQSLAVLRPNPKNPNGLPDVVSRLAEAALNDFRNSFLSPPLPRELIQRGQYFEVAPRLTETRKRYTQAENRLRTSRNRDQDLEEWAMKAQEVYLAVNRARQNNNQVELAQAGQRLELLWKNGATETSGVVDLLTAETGLAEATYLLAVSAHEQAERAYTRYQRARSQAKAPANLPKARSSAYEACAESVGWWDKYKSYAEMQKSRFPGRVAQSTELTERMKKLADELKP